MSESPQQQRLREDLGLGGKLSERSRARLLNHDGTFNVRRNDLGPFHPFNAYHTLLSLPVPRLLGLMAAFYVVVNVLFATLYWLAGSDALAGAARAPLARFEDSLFFSVQTLATIGYGRLVPNTRIANILVALEALVGLLGFAILSGLLFARFTRPTAKIVFSRNAIIAPYDGLAVRSATKVTRELLDAATNLKVVGRAGIGVDNVDIRSATARGVVVMNTPHGNTITTAEHAIAMMLALVRQIPEASASTKAGKWEKNRFMGVELTAKTLGLIGCGNIGSIVADRAVALKMRVLAYDPYLNERRALDLGVEKVELDDLLTRADIITLHTPLTDATRNIISREALAKTRPGVRIINCARGGLVDEAALAEAIESGHVAGAALDVFDVEPATASPLFGLENVV